MRLEVKFVRVVKLQKREFYLSGKASLYGGLKVENTPLN